jgi:hypothetical protein
MTQQTSLIILCIYSIDSSKPIIKCAWWRCFLSRNEFLVSTKWRLENRDKVTVSTMVFLRNIIIICSQYFWNGGGPFQSPPATGNIINTTNADNYR